MEGARSFRKVSLFAKGCRKGTLAGPDAAGSSDPRDARNGDKERQGRVGEGKGGPPRSLLDPVFPADAASFGEPIARRRDRRGPDVLADALAGRGVLQKLTGDVSDM